MDKDSSGDDTDSILRARAGINASLINKLNGALIGSLVATLTVVLIGGWLNLSQSWGPLFIGLGAFYFGILLGFLYSNFGTDESPFSTLATAITTLLTGALAADLTKIHDSLIYHVLMVLARASGLPSGQALGIVMMISIALGTIGFLLMYFNRRLILNVEMSVTSELMSRLSKSRQQVQKGEVDPSPESNNVSPDALKAAQEIVSNPFAGKSNRPSELVADAKAFYAMNNFNRAREVAAKALTYRPNDPEAMLYEASSILGNDEDMNEKKAAEAAKILEQFKPDSAPLIVNKLLGYCYLYLSNPSTARGKAKLKRSVELTLSYLAAQKAKGQDRDQGAVLNLACAYAQLGDEAGLIPVLQELVSANPSISKKLRSLPDFAAWLNKPAFNKIVPS